MFETIEKFLVMQKTLVTIEHHKITSVKCVSKDLASLETVINMYEIRGLIFGNLKKRHPTAQKNMF